MGDPLATKVVITALTERPEEIGALTGGLTEETRRHRPGPNEWSAVEVLAHLRACADVWDGAIEAIAVRRVDQLCVVNPRSWAAETDSPTLGFHPS